MDLPDDDKDDSQGDREENDIALTRQGKRERSPRKETSEAERVLEERRAANRRSAFQSRQRRKILIDELQRTVESLSKEKCSLQKQNQELKNELQSTELELSRLRLEIEAVHSRGGASLEGGVASLHGQLPYSTLGIGGMPFSNSNVINGVSGGALPQNLPQDSHIALLPLLARVTSMGSGNGNANMAVPSQVIQGILEQQRAPNISELLHGRYLSFRSLPDLQLQRMANGMSVAAVSDGTDSQDAMQQEIQDSPDRQHNPNDSEEQLVGPAQRTGANAELSQMDGTDTQNAETENGVVGRQGISDDRSWQ